MEGYLNLASAILIKARDDYWLKRGSEYPHRKEVEIFLGSQWYKTLCDYMNLNHARAAAEIRKRKKAL